jgi:aryl-alcohol dehydrogenase-like predicted oxidoreductase
LPGHTGGESEEIIGHWMKIRHNRSSIILATKVRHPMGPDPTDQGLSRKHILEAIDASLRRLNTDYIDLYLMHAFDAETPIDETLRTLDDLQRVGKLRYVGASNYRAWRLVEALWNSDVGAALQPCPPQRVRTRLENNLRAVSDWSHSLQPFSKWLFDRKIQPERDSRERTRWLRVETLQQ